MIIYSAVPPFLDSEICAAENISEIKNGVLSFYEKDLTGNRVLKFTTDPKVYLESEKPLQEYLTK